MDYVGRVWSCQPLHSSVLDFADYIGRVSSFQSTYSCVLGVVRYTGRVSNCQPICSCVLTSVDGIRVPSIHKSIPVWIGFSCLCFYVFHLGSQFILVNKIVF